MQRDQILANHDRRKEQLKKLLAEAREKVEEHESGRTLLEDEEYTKFTKRIGLYERKVSCCTNICLVAVDNWVELEKEVYHDDLTASLSIRCI
jgi:hypothetical protein